VSCTTVLSSLVSEMTKTVYIVPVPFILLHIVLAFWNLRQQVI
jgi:hypothetical protein